jgi:hypothetical protein
MAGAPSIRVEEPPDTAAYAYTATLSRSSWAWEFLRREAAFRRAAMASVALPKIWRDHDATLVYELPRRTPEAESWGLHFLPDPTLPGGDAPLFWLPSIYRNKLVARPSPPEAGSDSPLRLPDIPGRKSLLRTAEGCVKLAIEGHSFAALIAFEGKLAVLPEALILTVEHGGISDLDTRLRALQAFIDYCRGSFRPAPSERGFGPQRLKDALIALDGKLAGASLRQIAEMLFGPEPVARDWNHGSGITRERARRAVRRGVALMTGGWRDLLA